MFVVASLLAGEALASSQTRGDVGAVSEGALALAELVASARAGSRVACAELYRRFHRMVHGIALTRLPRADAEDLVQEVFITAFRELASVSDPERVGGWLATVARRRAVDYQRRRRARTEELGEHAQHPPPTSEAEEALRAIGALPDAYRETLMLRLVEGLTGPEIAALTDMTPESVRVNLCRGMKLLRARLEGRDAAGGDA